MENDYERIIHHVSTLIVHNQENRAMNILNYIIEQGICNSEVLVLLSYCVKKIKGINAAVLMLQKCGNQGPLIQMALGQYYRELGDRNKCLEFLTKIQATDNGSGLSEVCTNLQISLQPDNKPPRYTLKYTAIDSEAINLLNDIIEKYKNQDDPPTTTRQKLKELLFQRKIEGKLKQIVVRYAKFLELEIAQCSRQ